MAYYVAFAIVVPMMIRIPIRLSSGEPSSALRGHAADETVNHPNYWTYAGRLSNGWLFGWKVVSQSTVLAS
jgi:hypothetical protein